MANCNHRGVGVELRNVKRQCQSITDIAMKVPRTSFFSRCALSINTLNIPWCINLHFGFNLGEMLSMPQKIVSKQLNRCLGVWFWLKSLPLVGYAMDYVVSFGFDHLSALFHVFHTFVLLPVWRSKIISKLNIIFGSSCKDVLLWTIAVSFSQSLLELYSGEAIPAKAAVALCTGQIKWHLSSEQLLLD
jgi:hypothetical protein